VVVEELTGQLAERVTRAEQRLAQDPSLFLLRLDRLRLDRLRRG
jgi:hypothetical protein